MTQQTDKIVIGAGGELTRNETTGELEYSKDGTVPNRAPLSQGFLGEVRMSFLDETPFQAIAGPGWVLSDGRSINPSDLFSETGMTIAPDTRAEFLRGNDDGGSPAGARSIDTGRVVGTAQANSTALPTTPFTGTAAGTVTGTTALDGQHSHEEGSTLFPIAPNNYSQFGTTTGAAKIYLDSGATVASNVYAVTDTFADHGHSFSTSLSSGTTAITGGGDAETRPRNVSINFFMKINY